MRSTTVHDLWIYMCFSNNTQSYFNHFLTVLKSVILGLEYNQIVTNLSFSFNRAVVGL